MMMISGATEEELEIANDRADLLLKIRELENINDKLSSALNSAENKLDQLTNNWNELEECVESRLMSIPDDICTNEVEEARRTTKIAVYQVILGKMKEIKERNDK